MKYIKTYLALMLLLTFAVGCSGSASPTKEQFISDLKSVFELLDTEKFEQAADYFKAPGEVPKQEIVKDLKRFTERDEISQKGIEILEQNGSFGKLKEIFPERGLSWAERNEITTLDDCYAMSFEGAEVAALWDGGKFVFFRMDDVGKLH